MAEMTKARVIGFIRRQILPLLIVVVVLCAVRSSLADWNDVPSGSMQPTILVGERVFVNKLAYDLKVPFTTWHIAEWGGPKRGEILIFYSPTNGTRLVKRCIGLPGDTIELRDNHLFINGQEIPWSPLSDEALAKIPDDVRHDYLHQEDSIFFSEALPGHVHPVAEIITPHNRSQPRRNYGPVVVPPHHYFMMGDNRDNSEDSRYIGFVDRSLIVGHATAVVASLDIDHHWAPRWGRFFTKLP